MEAGQKLGRLLSREKTSKKLDERLATSCRQFFTQKIEFRAARGPDSHLEHLRARYTPLNKAYLPRTSMEAAVLQENAVSSSRKDDVSRLTKADGIPEPKMVLFNSSHLVMGWRESRAVGSGLCNLGNTCFLNSVLQCLTYTPPLYNYISSGHHSNNCNTQAFCAMCEFHRHCMRVFNSTNGQVKPIPIVKNLRAIARHFHQGRQEDAHEFLRYFIDSLQKCCLQGITQKLDVHTKATSLVHQIFGGYHRSQVKCLDCTKMSDTFDPLLDISVDIKSSQTLLKALQHYIKPDLLDGDNSYACPFCKKMTQAQKRLTVHRLPKVLTIQLKRFDYNSMFGGKVNKAVTFPEYLNMRPFMSQREGPSEWYRLYGVLVHFGFSCHSGHYYCYVRNSNNVWFCMNDSQVTQVSLSTVLSQEAYLLFYIKDEDYKPRNIPFPPGIKFSSSTHFKVDPNFLKTSAHCTGPDKPDTPVVKPAGLDKTGTPLIKLPMSKPTGVVQPSPQKDTSKETSKGQSLSPPEISSTAVTSKAKSVSPTNSCGSSGSGGRETSPLTREFSIPLRKISSTTPPSRVISDKADGATKKGSSEPVSQQTTPTVSTTAATASLRFTPRQISAPPKSKKLQKTSTVSSATVNIESERAAVDDKMEVATIATQPTIEIVPSITGQSESSKTEAKEGSTILDYATEPKAAPAFKAIQYEEAPQLFIGPTLPLSASSPSLPQSPLRVSPFSLKAPTSVSPKVALVQPQPQARGKPVARVRPNPHLEESKSEKDSTQKEQDQTASTPAPHVNAVSPWKVRESRGSEAFGPALPEGLEYNSSAHGWSVSTISGVGDDQHHSKAKKHKKKKKHRKHEEDRNESGGGKRDQPKKELSKRTKDHCDISRSPERSHRHRSCSPVERGRNHYPPHHAPGRAPHHRYGAHQVVDRGPHHDHGRHWRPGRHGHGSRDRDTAEHSRRHKHKASHHYHHDRSRPSSRSRSRSPLNTASEEHHRRERHRTSPQRHTHHHTPPNIGHAHHNIPPNMGHTHHHAPFDFEGKTKKKHHSHHHSAYPHHRDKWVNDKFDEARRRERKRSHHHDNDHDGLSDKEHEHKKHKKTTVPVVEWDSAGKVSSKWDGSHHSSTVEQLTSLSHRSLGENVKSWDGGDNIIDSSKMEGEGERKERDAWDAELDKGKLKKVKKVHHGNQFSSGRNAFQEFQNKRNISSSCQVKSDS